MLPKDQFVRHFYEIGIDQEEEAPLSKAAFPIDRFKPIVELGRGTLGTVWLARDRILNKRVAIKLLNKHDAKSLMALQSEAKAISRLRHPHIVEVIDLGITDSSIAYLVLEYVAGIPLSYVIQKSGPLSWSTCQGIFSQLCEALSYAHEHGTFHRDVKSSNILLVAEEPGSYCAKLIDFGMARLIETVESQANTLAGSPLYMAPDTGLGFSYDARSEIYSLGCVLFESLTGTLPFVSNDPLEVLSLHANGSVPSLADSSGAEWPLEVERIIQVALAKKKEERFQTALEFRDAIRFASNQVLLSHAVDREPDCIDGASSDELKRGGKAGSSSLNSMERSPTLMLVIASMCVLGFYVILYTVLFQDRLQASRQSYTKPEPDSGLVEDLQFDKNKWRAVFKHGQKVYVGSPELTDNDFTLLNKYNDVESIELFTINESITGEGFNLLKNADLKTIGLASTALSDKGMKAISSFEHLRALTLEWNTQLTDHGMNCLPRLKQLQCLDLRYMKLPANSLRTLGICSTLKELTISSSKPFDRGELALLASLPELEDLTLTDQRIDDSDCSVFSIFKALKKLSLKNNILTDRATPELAVNGDEKARKSGDESRFFRTFVL